MLTTSAKIKNSKSKRSNVAYTGLDIGTHSAKMVVRRWKAGGWKVVRASCLRWGDSLGNDAQEWGQRLRPWLRENAEPSQRLFVGTIPSCFVDYEAVDLEANAVTGTANQAAQDKMRQILGESLNQAAYDYWINQDRPGTMHLAWTDSGFASQLAVHLARDGWLCHAFDFPGQALSRIANNSPKSHQLIVDLSVGEVTLVYTKAEDALYVRNRIRFSNDSAADVLASSLGLQALASEQLLNQWGIGYPDGNKSPIELLITEHVGHWLEQLAFEIRRTLQYLQHRFDAKATPDIVLCGGGADIRGLPEWLSWRMECSARHAALPNGWIWETAEPYSPIYSQAICLSQYGELL